MSVFELEPSSLKATALPLKGIYVNEKIFSLLLFLKLLFLLTIFS